VLVLVGKAITAVLVVQAAANQLAAVVVVLVLVEIQRSHPMVAQVAQVHHRQ
jgi:hypothetical protein